MSTHTKSGSGSRTDAGAIPGPSKRHFDTFETKFFEQGDEVPEVEAERFDDLDERKRPRFAPPRQLVIGVALGSACVAILGCVALWRGGGHTASTPAASPSARAAAVAPAAPESPSPASPVVAAEAARPTGPVLAVAAPPAPAPAAEPAARPSPPAAPAGGESEAACQAAIHDKRSKEIVAACTRAFDDDPTAAAAALAVARAEFDRGHGTQALIWGKKAVAIDPDAADAYVFIGGAEQSAGHGKAAKEAFQHYLQLAPSGRYAADLRAIVGRL